MGVMRSRKADRQLIAFGKRLRFSRLVAGYEKAAAFSRDLGVTEARYRRYERGGIQPPIDVLIEAAVLTGRTLDFLLGVPSTDEETYDK